MRPPKLGGAFAASASQANLENDDREALMVAVTPIPETECECGEPWFATKYGTVMHGGGCPLQEKEAILKAFEKAEKHGLIEKLKGA